MSGIGLLADIAKSSLATQQFAMGITGHNIANVNTKGYTRQDVSLAAKDPAPYGDFMLGRGVEVWQVVRQVDDYIDARISQHTYEYKALEQTESYMTVLEGMFNETSENGLSAQMVDFWNAWHDLSNNPAGQPERSALFEKSEMFVQTLNTTNSDLQQFVTELNMAIDAGISQANSLTSDIADLNGQIVSTEVEKIANDLRDRRDTLVKQLSEYIDITSFNQPNGAITINTAKGLGLVIGSNSYEMNLAGGTVGVESSGSSSTDITDSITGGKLGGWLEVRDKLLPEYRAAVDVLTKNLIWEVNSVHSQGVGLDYFNQEVAGTYETEASGLLATLDFGQNIDYSKDLTIWIDDGTTKGSATVDLNISDSSIAQAGVGQAGNKYTFTVTSAANTTVAAANTQDIAWENSDGDSGTITITGGGTYNVDGTLTITLVNGDSLIEGNTVTANTDSAGAVDPLDASVSGSANSALDTYVFTVASGGGGTIGTDTITLEWYNSASSGTVEITGAGDYTVDGMTLTFTSGTVMEGDSFVVTTNGDKAPAIQLPSDWHWTITSFSDQINRDISDAGLAGLAASVSGDALVLTPTAGYSYGFADDNSGMLAAIGINTFFNGSDSGSISINDMVSNTDNIAAAKIGSDGAFATGDNSNALDIADAQFEDVSMQKWTYSRGSEATSQSVSSTMEEYYSTLVSSIGIKSQSITREKEFKESLVDKLIEVRESVSSVSLDEEMIKLLQYQYAYQGAARLLASAKESLDQLMNTVAA
ncbi:MAG: flagellar hook-associated protein FlgK [Pseudomonadota bacterium]